MDFSLLALISVVVVTVVLSTSYNRRTWSGPGYQFQRVFSVGAFGLWLTVAGAIGWDVSHVHGFFQGTTWVGRPIWWQLGLGLVLLSLAVFMGRRVTYPPPRPHGKL